MTDRIWMPIAAIGIIAAVASTNIIMRIGFRGYCALWIRPICWVGERTGLLQPPPSAQKPIKKKTRKDIKDL